MLFYLVPSCTHFCMLSRQYCFICVCLEKELRKSLVIPDSHEQWLLQCKISLRIVSRDTARQAPPPSEHPPPSEQFDYQIKNLLSDRLSKIVCQRSFTCKSKINCKNRSSKIDFILDVHAYHILPEFCRKRRSISYWVHF